MALALVALTLTPQDAQAQWQWRDAQGRVTVSDRPPPSDVPASAVISRPTAGMSTTGAIPTSRPAATASASAGGNTVMASTSPGSGKDPALEATRKKNMEEAAEKKRMDEEKAMLAKRDNCSRARGQALSIETGQRMTRINAQGEREHLDDKGRAEELARTREVISSSCN
jgi:Domain of unknown function (DUF4124)